MHGNLIRTRWNLDGLFLSFLTTSFFTFVLLSVFETRYLRLVWTVQRVENDSEDNAMLNFYSKLCIFMWLTARFRCDFRICGVLDSQQRSAFFKASGSDCVRISSDFVFVLVAADLEKLLPRNSQSIEIVRLD